jgi:hypothetical protein
MLDDARHAGLFQGGPEIDRDQAQWILAALRANGVRPSEDEVLACAIEMIEEVWAGGELGYGVVGEREPGDGTEADGARQVGIGATSTAGSEGRLA